VVDMDAGNRPPGVYTPDGYLVRPLYSQKAVPSAQDAPEPPTQEQFDQVGQMKEEAAAAAGFPPFPWQVIRPEWLDPPKDAKFVDIRTDPGVVLAAASVNVLLCGFQIPDRYVGIFWRFGQALSSPALFGTVTWTLQVNDAPEQFYNMFSVQTGEFVRPTRFEAPIKVKYNDIIQVTASNPGLVPVVAFARLMGWVFPVADEEISRFMTL